MKKFKISLLIFVFAISIVMTVNANSASINLGASSDVVKAGEEFTVTLIGTADNNITGLGAKLEYDTNKLSIQKKTEGTGFYLYPSEENEIAIGIKDDKVELSKTATLCTVTFKVADTVKAGELEVKFKNIELAVVNEKSEQAEIAVEDKSISVDVMQLVLENKVENNVTNNTTNDSKLPQTGIEDVNFALVAGLMVIASASYLMYRRYNNI